MNKKKAMLVCMTGVVVLGTTAMAQETLVSVPTGDSQTQIKDTTGKENTVWYMRKSGDEEWKEIRTEESVQASDTETQAQTEGEADTEAEIDEKSTEEENLYDLKMTDKEDKTYIWYGLALEDIQDVELGVTEEDQVFEKYVTADKKEAVDTTEYAVTTWEEQKEMYCTSDLNLRQFPDQEAEVMEVLSFGSEVEACGGLDGWYLVYTDGKFGYVSSDYVTEDSAKVEELRVSMQTEEQQWETEAYVEQNASSASDSKKEQKETSAPETSAPETSAPETSAPETSAPETSAPETSEPETSAPETSAPETSAPETSAPETTAPETTAPETQRVEVSRENVADCNDPDHGTTYITYSDGSVDVEEY